MHEDSNHIMLLIIIQFVSEEFTARTVQAHKTVCFLLESTSNQQHMETTYGVRRDSILNSLRYFHVITGNNINEDS